MGDDNKLDLVELLPKSTSKHILKSKAPAIFSASAPLVHNDTKEQRLKQQISAPSYFHSLKKNEAPPFKPPGKEARPCILIGTIVNEAEAIDMIAAADSDQLTFFLGYLLVNKNIMPNYNLSEKSFLISFLSEAIDYAAQRDFNAFKLACLLNIYVTTHIYFKAQFWTSPFAVWEYFKELMIRHTIEDSPNGQEVFSPEECYDILTHFHTIYLTNLPLIHIITFGAYRLTFTWPFKPK